MPSLSAASTLAASSTHRRPVCCCPTASRLTSVRSTGNPSPYVVYIAASSSLAAIALLLPCHRRPALAPPLRPSSTSLVATAVGSATVSRCLLMLVGFCRSCHCRYQPPVLLPPRPPSKFGGSSEPRTQTRRLREMTTPKRRMTMSSPEKMASSARARISSKITRVRILNDSHKNYHSNDI